MPRAASSLDLVSRRCEIYPATEVIHPQLIQASSMPSSGPVLAGKHACHLTRRETLTVLRGREKMFNAVVSVRNLVLQQIQLTMRGRIF